MGIKESDEIYILDNIIMIKSYLLFILIGNDGPCGRSRVMGMGLGRLVGAIASEKGASEWWRCRETQFSLSLDDFSSQSRKVSLY